jgi:hypothetical protein
MKYEYQGPGRPAGIAAPVVAAELDRLHLEHGEIKPVVVVEASVDEDAPLHGAFEWDDEAAADEHRLSQARQLIRAVVMVPEPERGEVFPTARAFVSIAIGPGSARAYRPMMVAMAAPDERDQVLRRMRNELQSMRSRYRDILEIANVAAAFDALDESVAS